MNKNIHSAGRVILAVVGICFCCGLYLAFGRGLNPKFHSAIIGGLAILFIVSETTLYGILRLSEDVQKTRALAARQYEILVERISVYRRLALNIMKLNLLLRILAAAIAGCLYLSQIDRREFWLCLIGYAAVGWSVSWFFYLFSAFRKLTVFKAELDAVNRDVELSGDYVAKMKSSHP